VDHADRTFEPTEALRIAFDAPVDPKALQNVIAISPSAPFSIYPIDYGRAIRLTFRKVPGTTYVVSFTSAIRNADGTQSPAPASIVVHTAGVAVPAPLRSAPGPYRYGALAHPFPFSLDGPTADRQIALLADAGVRFVRIDYVGAQIEPEPGRFDWTIPDRIASKLAARGITELPIVEQYSAAPWATMGQKYPAIWADPGQYATFAGAIAAHVRTQFPNITRLELFNEPNLHGWWKSPDPRYAAVDGSATATYMSAAYAAIKRAAPSLTVAGPALASGGRFTDPRAFLETLYANGCRRGSCWDVLSVHNYCWQNPSFAADEATPARFDIYKALQRIAAAHGDPDTHVMLTEWGYSTDPASPDAVDPAVQAAYLAVGFNLMLADPSVDGIVYVNVYNPGTDFWGQTALTTPDFARKPAYAVFQRFAEQ
jgi:hypothetical protein